MKDYVVATVKPWNVSAFWRCIGRLPGRWHLIERREELTWEHISAINPRYVFFPHWSWRVPTDVLSMTECICFHMTDVPFGRGGSPLQNLLIRGIAETQLSALRMIEEIDAGPVYLKLPLSLEGRAQDIYERAAQLVYDAIEVIVLHEPEPERQVGEVRSFPRRNPEQSALPLADNLDILFDHIRMLDAETYPAAYIDHGAHRIEFRNVARSGDGLVAEVTIRLHKARARN